MTNLRPIEMSLVLELFETSPGYILDFSNRTFAEFFEQEVAVDIYNDAYADLGTSKGKRFRTFVQKGQRAAIAKALIALWEYREAILRRSGVQDSVTNGLEELSRLIERLGGTPIRSVKPATKEVKGPDEAEFDALHTLDPQPRGYTFERFLKKHFDACGLEAREAFRLKGEQIDGSFQLGETYLVEARWQNAPADAGSLRSFQGKVEDRPAWARGLFISYAGFSSDGLSAFGARRIILMDGLDLHDALRRRIPLDKVITAKVRRSTETGNVFVRVRDLFPE